MLIYPVLLSMLKASEEDKLFISAIYRYLRSESEYIFSESNVDCPYFNGEEYKTVIYTTRIKDTINPFIFPKITTTEFGCSETTYVTHLTNLYMFLSRICAIINRYVPMDYCPETFLTQPDNYNVTILLECSENMVEFICAISLVFSSYSDLHQDLSL